MRKKYLFSFDINYALWFRVCPERVMTQLNGYNFCTLHCLQKKHKSRYGLYQYMVVASLSGTGQSLFMRHHP